MIQHRFVRIFHNNVKTSHENLVFDVHNKESTEAPIFVKVKKFLKQHSIYLNTYDISTPIPSYRDIHIDVPYPLPSNLSIWRSIVLNRYKNILICTEPPTVDPLNYLKIVHAFFVKVYTWNDALVDNKKYFKYYLPKVSTGMDTRAKKFIKKKFLVLINKNILPFYPFQLLSPFGRELYSERIKAIDFFGRTIPNDFFLYGRGWNKPTKYSLGQRIFGFKKYPAYKGEVTDKFELLSHFKYCLCFENLTDVKGFITEKIFDCFKARCVPIYWGAIDIQNYIPKSCFIDFRDFLDYQKLLDYLISIDESTYNRYIQSIEKLLADKKRMTPWFEDGYAKFFLEDVLEMR